MAVIKIYDYTYGIVTPDILMQLVSCYGFSIGKHEISILTFRINLVSYYLSRCFMFIESNRNGLKSIPIVVKNRVH